RTAGLAGLSLDRPDQLFDVPVEVLQLVVRELPPLAPQLAFDFVPVTLKRLSVHHRNTPLPVGGNEPRQAGPVFDGRRIGNCRAKLRLERRLRWARVVSQSA